MQQHVRIVNCPQCGKKVVWESNNRFRPFCSERCKINDLSQWAQESYRIPESTEPEKKQEEKD